MPSPPLCAAGEEGSGRRARRASAEPCKAKEDSRQQSKPSSWAEDRAKLKHAISVYEFWRGLPFPSAIVGGKRDPLRPKYTLGTYYGHFVVLHRGGAAAASCASPQLVASEFSPASSYYSSGHSHCPLLLLHTVLLSRAWMEKSRTQVADELLDLGNRDFSFSLSSMKTLRVHTYFSYQCSILFWSKLGLSCTDCHTFWFISKSGILRATLMT